MNLRHGTNKISLKVKAIIFCALSVIVIVIAAKNIINNNSMKDKSTNNTSQTATGQKIIKESKSEDGETKDKEAEKLESQYKKAESLFRNKQYAESIKEADSIIKQDKDFYKAYNIKGIALCYSNNFEEGMNNIDKSLELNPEYGYARFNKALAYELYGQYDKALIWYDKDLQIEDYVWSYYGKASIYGRRGDVENTVKYLKIALNMAPEIKSIAKNEKDFDPVRNSKSFQDLFK
ncbi:hypothetical protein H2684_10510 [Clostridium sp. cel8]|jgi:tetratricopeptide (TPR) repeat protein|uniref:tetratricopeptide repeat protein n=1 Tax=unclassified Clostridium TaxID=2614128 RepID=UPI0015F65B0C|nr:tetratricopeptide repeat protein [Clostridium sp. cel8]MBA5851725.1 hypothetical protein [Clostridium sp. cel8]